MSTKVNNTMTKRKNGGNTAETVRLDCKPILQVKAVSFGEKISGVIQHTRVPVCFHGHRC